MNLQLFVQVMRVRSQWLATHRPGDARYAPNEALIGFQHMCLSYTWHCPSPHGSCCGRFSRRLRVFFTCEGRRCNTAVLNLRLAVLPLAPPSHDSSPLMRWLRLSGYSTMARPIVPSGPCPAQTFLNPSPLRTGLRACDTLLNERCSADMPMSCHILGRLGPAEIVSPYPDGRGLDSGFGGLHKSAFPLCSSWFSFTRTYFLTVLSSTTHKHP